MKMKNSLYFLYQQLKNGNLRRVVRNMNRSKTKMLEDLEDMIQ